LALANTEVLALTPAGDEHFGTFDCVIGAPLAVPAWSDTAWIGLLRKNLRPGGRFVVDLPGAEMSADLTAVWVELGYDPELLLPFRGPDGEELAATLRADGLRTVHAALGAHLLQLPSTHELIELLQPALHLDEAQRLEVGVALARRLHTTQTVDCLVQRTRVHGIH
jgi:hypothetical protein